MKHYVLVHGAWEGSWTWRKSAAVLAKHGHRVTAVDLPGSSGRPQPIAEVTMAGYIQTVIDVIDPLDHQVVLVGHSLGGAVISQVAERLPAKIERLVYVAAFLLKNGDTALAAMQSDPKGEFLAELTFADDGNSIIATEDLLRRVAFHDVEEAEIQHSLAQMADRQAAEPFVAKVVLSAENFGSVPKTYIRTSLDKIVSPVLQEEMLPNWDVEQVHILEAGHFPTQSIPAKLGELML